MWVLCLYSISMEFPWNLESYFLQNFGEPEAVKQLLLSGLMNFCFLLFSTVSFTKTVHFEKANFVDWFAGFNQTLWSREHRTFHCTSHRLNSCAVTSNENFAFGPIIPKRKIAQSKMMTMWLKNDCFDQMLSRSGCCDRNETRCTEFTTARLNSRERYGFGRYAIMLRTQSSYVSQSSESNDMASTISCFSLASKEVGALVEISICWRSRSAFELKVVWRMNDYRETRVVPLRFDTSAEAMIYAIDFFREKLQIIVNGAKGAEIIFEKKSRAILSKHPPEFMITVHMRPLPMDIGFLPNTILHLLHVYRIAHLPLQTSETKSELFFIGNINDSLVYFSSFAFLISTSALTLLYIYCKNPLPSTGYQRLQDDDEHTSTSYIFQFI